MREIFQLKKHLHSYRATRQNCSCWRGKHTGEPSAGQDPRTEEKSIKPGGKAPLLSKKKNLTDVRAEEQTAQHTHQDEHLASSLQQELPLPRRHPDLNSRTGLQTTHLLSVLSLVAERT